ncbi:MAG: tyrosine-type recombinase/integrase [Burkholderiales bacterium]|nr:tyrosine-type recombinase/integrase [Burkholderiales bacterium]
MLSELFDAPARIRAIRSGPAAALIEGFAEQLLQRGYAKISARRHVRSAEHIVRWAIRRGLSPRDLGDRALKDFSDHLSRCRCGRYSCANRMEVVAGARLFVRQLQGVDQPPVRDPQPAPAEPDLLKSFCAWMRERRGTSDRGLYNYSIPIRELLRRIAEDPSALDARCLRQFALEQSQGGRWVARRCRTALRMFLRFLIAEGRCRAGLLGAIPIVPHWRLAALPRYLPPEDVERLIVCCDPSSAVGKRDRAVLLLLARLGLRAGDIVQMRLGDIDWKGAWVHVSGKSRRQARLPLTQEVGQAIAAYLQAGRPAAPMDALFLRSRAPFRALGSHCAVSMIVARAFRRTGVKRPGRGAAHLLRHSIASSMLRQGASLQEISTLLRHRSIETTQIYAKVDLTGLQQIAQPWPQVQPC